MGPVSLLRFLGCIALTGVLATAGCHGNQQPASTSSESNQMHQNSRPEAGHLNELGPPRVSEHQPEPVYPETGRAPQRYGQSMQSAATPGEPTRPQTNREEPGRVQPQ